MQVNKKNSVVLWQEQNNKYTGECIIGCPPLPCVAMYDAFGATYTRKRSVKMRRRYRCCQDSKIVACRRWSGEEAGDAKRVDRRCSSCRVVGLGSLLDGYFFTCMYYHVFHPSPTHTILSMARALVSRSCPESRLRELVHILVGTNLHMPMTLESACASRRCRCPAHPAATLFTKLSRRAPKRRVGDPHDWTCHRPP